MEYPNNLNKLQYDNVDGESFGPKLSNIYLKNINIDNFELYIINIKEELIKKIKEHDGPIVGNIAWLTDADIIMALADKSVQLIIQKEDFLRPDTNKYTRQDLLALYEILKCNISTLSVNDSMNYCGDPSIEPIRCIGNLNSDKKPAHPRAHNKFLIFCKYEKQILKEEQIQQYYKQEDLDWCAPLIPEAVWTGSFNFTHNAGNSLENAIYFKGNNNIVKQYYDYYVFMLLCSENLNPEWNWSQPDYRIGS